MANLNENYRNGPDQILPACDFKTWKPDVGVQLNVANTGSESLKPISVYSLFEKAAEDFGNDPALAIKRDGEWRYWSYQEYFNTACLVAKAMIKLGLERFHGVCIMGSNAPEWVFAFFGAIFAGGLSTGVYATNSPEVCQYIANDCQAQIIVVENSDSLRKFLSAKEKLPQVKAIVQWSGLPAAPGVLSWPELLAIGSYEDDEILRERLSLTAINQACCLVYTSGTTGFPKGVMCSQDHISWIANSAKGFGENARLISHLPLSHTTALLEFFRSLATKKLQFFALPDALKGSLLETISEVNPTSFFTVPRIWEKIHEKLQEEFHGLGPIKKGLYSWAQVQGLNYSKAVKNGRELSLNEKWKYSLAKFLVLDKIKASLGFLKCQRFFTGSAPISQEILDFFNSIDIPLITAYGLSESMARGAISFFLPNNFKEGSVGKAIPGTTILKSDSLDGEVCLKGRSIFMGYLNMADKTNETIDDNGFLHTGDLGYIDEDGFLFITGRSKELVITAGGENIPPILIEEAIKKELPFISEVLLVGDQRKYLTVLLTLKANVDRISDVPLGELTSSCMQMLKGIGSNASTVEEARKEVKENPNGALASTIQNGINRYNERAISNAQKVQKFTILPRDFSVVTNELTASLKLKRSFILKKYSALIDQMYDDTSLARVSTFKSKL